jgi:hypothetical protein
LESVVALPPPKALLHAGKHPLRKLKRAQILLAADAGGGDQKIAISVGGWAARVGMPLRN